MVDRPTLSSFWEEREKNRHGCRSQSRFLQSGFKIGYAKQVVERAAAEETCFPTVGSRD
jgi:hypothetical protein